MSAPFSTRLAERVRLSGGPVCLGIDPRPAAHPSTDPERHGGDPARVARAVVDYFREILESCHDLLACVKPQSAFFERLGIPGLIALAQLMVDADKLGLPVLLDAKRGDVGSTAEAYAEAYLGQGVFSADALTVNPYLGFDALEPFFSLAESNHRGVFVLVKTSNPGSADLQDLITEGGERVHETLASRLTERAAQCSDELGLSPIGAVIGATHPERIADLRARLPHSWLLLPGYGAQGGNAAGIGAAFRSDGLGALVSASRSLSYFGDDPDFAGRAREAVLTMRADIAGELARGISERPR